MGSRIARRLLSAGHPVVAWNRTRDRVEELARDGAEVASNPADAARRADAVITMVSDPPALAAVSEGAQGVAAGATGSTTVIEMSTVGPAAVKRFVSILPDGCELLDAPVLGSLAEAESGALNIFVGGSGPLFERWKPLLSVLGTPLYVGPQGTGASAKLVANSTLFGMLGVLGEALALAEGLGLSREAAFSVLAATPLAAQAERRRSSIETGEYPPRFTLSLAEKDAGLVVDAATDAGVDVRLARAAQTWLTEARLSGRGDEDYSAVLAQILDLD